jgi:hypothetical protein
VPCARRIERHELSQQGRTERKFARAFAAGLQTGAAIDLAARQGTGDVLAQQRFYDAQLIRQPEMQVEET